MSNNYHNCHKSIWGLLCRNHEEVQHIIDRSPSMQKSLNPQPWLRSRNQSVNLSIFFKITFGHISWPYKKGCFYLVHVFIMLSAAETRLQHWYLQPAHVVHKRGIFSRGVTWTTSVLLHWYPKAGMTTRIIIILGTSPGLGSLCFWEFALALLTPAPSTYFGSISKQRKGHIKEGFPSVLLKRKWGQLTVEESFTRIICDIQSLSTF